MRSQVNSQLKSKQFIGQDNVNSLLSMKPNLKSALKGNKPRAQIDNYLNTSKNFNVSYNGVYNKSERVRFDRSSMLKPSTIYNQRSVKLAKSSSGESRNFSSASGTTLTNKKTAEVVTQKSENVWDRLYKVKRVENTTNIPASKVRSRQSLVYKKSLKLPAVRNLENPANANCNSQFMNRKTGKPTSQPVIFSGSSISKDIFCHNRMRHVTNAREMCESKNPPNTFGKPRIPTVSLVKPTTPRVTIQQIDSMPEYVDIDQYRQSISKDSLDVYEVPPLIPVPTRSNLEDVGSTTILKNFQNVLEQKHRTMDPDEISMLKRVVKTDKRSQNVQRHDIQLFREILQTQLKEIIKQEAVVKSALNKLQSVEDVTSTNKYPIDNSEKCLLKPQVDVVFKNVPTLEKEIFILQALGDKLEATIKRTTQRADNKQDIRIKTPPRKFRVMHLVTDIERVAQVHVRTFGVLINMGSVREFYIARKTIDELKMDDSSPFYLPVNVHNTELRCTTFKKLKRNPDMLLHHLKSKNPINPFNFLDHDTFFFNSMLLKNKNSIKGAIREILPPDDKTDESDEFTTMHSGTFYKLPYKDSKDAYNVTENLEDKLKHTIKEQNKTNTSIKIEDVDLSYSENLRGPSESEVEISIKKAVTNFLVEPENEVPKKITPRKEIILKNLIETPQEITQHPKLFEAPIRGNKRRRIRRCVLPLPDTDAGGPKTGLITTFFVGIVQVAIFLMLILAFVYPDIIC